LDPERTQAVLSEGGVTRIVADDREKAGRATELLQRPGPAPEARGIGGREQNPPPRPARLGEDPSGGRPAPRARQRYRVPCGETEPVHVGGVADPLLRALREDGHIVTPARQ